MSYAEEEYNLAKSKMLSDFKKAINDAEALREAEAAGGEFAADEATVEEKPAGNPGG